VWGTPQRLTVCWKARLLSVTASGNVCWRALIHLVSSCWFQPMSASQWHPHQPEIFLWIWICGTDSLLYLTQWTGPDAIRNRNNYFNIDIFRFLLLLEWKELTNVTNECLVWSDIYFFFIHSTFIDINYILNYEEYSISRAVMNLWHFVFFFGLTISLTNCPSTTCESLMDVDARRRRAGTESACVKDFCFAVNRAAALTGFTGSLSWCCSCLLPRWTRLGGRCF